MAKIERKAYYVGTWREDVVTDTTMRQIIARSHAEKGQKVKVKLSKEGISMSKTVLFQENFMSSFPLKDVYFLTVNQRHPTCLLCIVADPVKKYLILAMRTVNEVEAQEIINTFQSLKETPDINAGNVVLKRKDNGNWTLRERSQHNADRHLQEIFKETTPSSSPVVQPNGHAGSYAPVLDGRKYRKYSPTGNRESTYSTSGSQTVVVDGSEGPGMVAMRDEVDHLSQELRDIKFVLEKAGSVSSTTLSNNNNNNTEKSHYILTDEMVKGGQPVTNGGVVSAHSNGDGYYDNVAGEARASVGDFRNSTVGIVRAQSNGSSLQMLNGKVQRQITVPEPNNTSSGHHVVSATVPASPTPTPAMTGNTISGDIMRGNTMAGPYVSAVNGYTEVPAYTVHRRVTTEYVQVPGANRRPSNASSVRSAKVKFDPEAVRRSQDHHNKFRSLRTSRSGVPTTIVRPIEDIYPHQGHPMMVVHHQRPPILKRHPQAVYAQHQQPPPLPSPAASHNNAMYFPQEESPYASVYVTQPPSPRTIHHQPHHHHHHNPQPGRRSRPNSVHVMDRNELKVYLKSGSGVDDILL